MGCDIAGEEGSGVREPSDSNHKKGHHKPSILTRQDPCASKHAWAGIHPLTVIAGKADGV